MVSVVRGCAAVLLLVCISVNIYCCLASVGVWFCNSSGGGAAW